MRPIPYKGNGKHIFISYAHKDSDKVYPIIARMQADGYNVWFDEGIDPGTEWDENIAEHIDSCSYFIAFLTANYLASNNCMDELSFARDLDKDRFLIYLEEVELPRGMQMRLNRLQAIYWNRYDSTNPPFNKLYAAPGIEVCRDDYRTAQPTPDPTPAPAPKYVTRYCMKCGKILPEGTGPMCPECLVKQRAIDAINRARPVQPTPQPTPVQPTPVQQTPVQPLPQPVPVQTTFHQPAPMNAQGKRLKKRSTALLLCWLLGWFGAHRFYEENYVMGVVYLGLLFAASFTQGISVIGMLGLWIYDLVMLYRKPEFYY